MTDFFDWLTASDSGAAAERLREQFRLSPDEMRRITEALAPAFLIGFQRLMAQPAVFNDFMRRAMLFGAEGRAADGGAAARPFLNELIGSNPLFEAVARQASTAAGVAPDTIRKMMPDLALLSVEAVTRMAGMNWSASTTPLPTDHSGQALAEALRRSANAVEALNRPSGAGRSGTPDLNALFADALKGGFPWMGAFDPSRAMARQPNENTPPASLPAPFAALFPMMEAFSRGLTPTGGTAAAAPRADAGLPIDPMLRMMDAGRSLQQSYTMEMLALFDRHRPRP